MREEENKVEQELMSEEDFKSLVHNISLSKTINLRIEASRKFKSVNRAIKRGKCSPLGEIYPKRPFNNRRPTRGRNLNARKKSIYANLKSAQTGI